MCLLTTWKKSNRAKRNITVYKIMNKGNEKPISPFQGFEYELKKLYKRKMERTSDMSNFDEYDEEERRKCCKDVISIGSGFHAALTLERLTREASNMRYYDFYKCVIPKGALYYKGFTDLIVANRIKILEKIEVKKEI